MTSVIDEGDLSFAFDSSWTVLQWDGCEFRRRREHAGRAADIVGRRDGRRTPGTYVIEIKDYPSQPGAPVPRPAALAAVCAEKVRDTLAQLVYAPSLVGRSADALTDGLCRDFGSTDYPLHVILWVEDAGVPPLDRVELQAELEQALRWLPATTITVFAIDDAEHPPGLVVTRIPTR